MRARHFPGSIGGGEGARESTRVAVGPGHRRQQLGGKERQEQDPGGERAQQVAVHLRLFEQGEKVHGGRDGQGEPDHPEGAREAEEAEQDDDAAAQPFHGVLQAQDVVGDLVEPTIELSTATLRPRPARVDRHFRCHLPGAVGQRSWGSSDVSA